MNIKKGDIFVHNREQHVYIVEQAIGRIVYMISIDIDGSVIPGITYFRTTVERYFTKLTI